MIEVLILLNVFWSVIYSEIMYFEIPGLERHKDLTYTQVFMVELDFQNN